MSDPSRPKIVDERAAVAAGATPRRAADVGPRLRRTRLRPAPPRADIRTFGPLADRGLARLSLPPELS